MNCSDVVYLRGDYFRARGLPYPGQSKVTVGGMERGHVGLFEVVLLCSHNSQFSPKGVASSFPYKARLPPRVGGLVFERALVVVAAAASC